MCGAGCADEWSAGYCTVHKEGGTLHMDGFILRDIRTPFSTSAALLTEIVRLEGWSNMALHRRAEFWELCHTRYADIGIFLGFDRMI